MTSTLLNESKWFYQETASINERVQKCEAMAMDLERNLCTKEVSLNYSTKTGNSRGLQRYLDKIIVDGEQSKDRNRKILDKLSSIDRLMLSLGGSAGKLELLREEYVNITLKLQSLGNDLPLWDSPNANVNLWENRPISKSHSSQRWLDSAADSGFETQYTTAASAAVRSFSVWTQTDQEFRCPHCLKNVHGFSQTSAEDSSSPKSLAIPYIESMFNENKPNEGIGNKFPPTEIKISEANKYIDDNLAIKTDNFHGHNSVIESRNQSAPVDHATVEKPLHTASLLDSKYILSNLPGKEVLVNPHIEKCVTSETNAITDNVAQQHYLLDSKCISAQEQLVNLHNENCLALETSALENVDNISHAIQNLNSFPFENNNKSNNVNRPTDAVFCQNPKLLESSFDPPIINERIPNIHESVQVVDKNSCPTNVNSLPRDDSIISKYSDAFQSSPSSFEDFNSNIAYHQKLDIENDNIEELEKSDHLSPSINSHHVNNTSLSSTANQIPSAHISNQMTETPTESKNILEAISEEQYSPHKDLESATIRNYLEDPKGHQLIDLSKENVEVISAVNMDSTAEKSGKNDYTSLGKNVTSSDKLRLAKQSIDQMDSVSSGISIKSNSKISQGHSNEGSSENSSCLDDINDSFFDNDHSTMKQSNAYKALLGIQTHHSKESDSEDDIEHKFAQSVMTKETTNAVLDPPEKLSIERGVQNTKTRKDENSPYKHKSALPASAVEKNPEHSLPYSLNQPSGRQSPEKEQSLTIQDRDRIKKKVMLLGQGFDSDIEETINTNNEKTVSEADDDFFD